MSVLDFETVLKEIVNAKRLSASKMTSLTDIAMKNMESDTKLVSILYRTHKTLPTTAAKISSLYVFDALSRAAKHHATKHGLSGDAFTSPGNAASFLFKVGGVVEGLFQDLVAAGTPESKEKSKKILDIWIKGSTFPSTILAPLVDILKGSQEASDAPTPIIPVVESPPAPPIPTVDPRTAPMTQSPPASLPITPPAPGIDQHAALLALLTQAAASTSNIPTIPTINTAISPPLDAAQLAVIQQLAHTAASVPSVPQFLPPPDLVNVQKFPSSSGVNGSSHSLPSYRNEPRTMVNGEQSHLGYRSPESEPRADSHFDERDNMRGRHRAGFRNRGRGERLGRTWDPRDRDHYRTNRDQSPPRAGRGGGRSRSRSPGPSASRYNARKDSRYSSPPRKPSINSPVARHIVEPGKDEFGRDIRPESPKSPLIVDRRSPRSPTKTLELPSDPRSSLTATSNHDSNHDSSSDSVLSLSVNANTSSAKTSSAPPVTETKEPGMENFNAATFDVTSAAQWEALGKMWKVTNGYLPSTQELMQFMMTATTGQPAPIPSVTTQDSHVYVSAMSGRGYSRERGWSRGGFARGRGGAYGNGRGMHLEGGAVYDNNYHKTDAIVLQEVGEEPLNNNFAMSAVGQAWTQKNEHEESSPNAGGRMQRVGDKWVFVRDTVMDIS